MGHYKKDGPHMESAKQERKDLLKDNPVVRDMDSSRPWMSKHFQSSMSPLKDMHGSPAEKELVGNQGNLPEELQAEIKAAPEMKEGMHMNYDSGINNNHVDSNMLAEMGKAAGVVGAAAGSIKPPSNDEDEDKEPQQMYHHIEKKIKQKPKLPELKMKKEKIKQ